MAGQTDTGWTDARSCPSLRTIHMSVRCSCWDDEALATTEERCGIVLIVHRHPSLRRAVRRLPSSWSHLGGQGSLRRASAFDYFPGVRWCWCWCVDIIVLDGAEIPLMLVDILIPRGGSGIRLTLTGEVLTRPRRLNTLGKRLTTTERRRRSWRLRRQAESGRGLHVDCATSLALSQRPLKGWRRWRICLIPHARSRAESGSSSSARELKIQLLMGRFMMWFILSCSIITWAPEAAQARNTSL